MKRMIELLQAVRQWLDSIQQDKLLHFIVGAMITVVFALIKPFAPYAFTCGIIAGILKEWYDGGNGGQKEFADFIATSIGALVAQIFVWLQLLCW